jgi:inhibitor of KinA sporulation pathway (predicted exonuclease)
MEAFNKLIKNKKTLVFLDLEGTQFSHEIIAIGAVKCKINEQGKITKGYQKKFKCYVKPLGQIGRFVQNMTQINEEILRNEGVTLETAFSKFKKFVNLPFEQCAFITFGSNDAKMIIDSITRSEPKNAFVGYNIVNNTVDFLMFISQFCKDNKNNNYSLVNYLKVFNVAPVGISHDPLNDALDLKNLYSAMNKQKETLLNEYLKILSKQKIYSAPIKNTIEKLINGENVTSEEFINECKKYLV